MNKRHFIRIISICMIISICALCFNVIPGFAKEPDIELGTSPQKDYDFWTFSDLGIANQTSNKNLNWSPKAAAIGDSIDKTVFNGKIAFPAGTNDFGNYCFGSSQNWYGFIIFANGTDGLKLYFHCKETGHFHNGGGDTGSTKHANNQIALFDPTTAGTTLRGNADLQFSISFEYVNVNGDHTDIKVGVFFDGKLYNNEYYTVKNVPKAELSKNLGFYVVNSAEYTVASHKMPKDTVLLKNSTEKDYTFWTFSDLGITDKTSNVNLNWDPKAAAVGDSIDKTVFNGKIDFPAGTTNFGNYYFGSSLRWYGFIIFANGSDGLKLYYNCKATGHFHNASGDTGSTAHANNQIALFDPSIAGTTLRGNPNLQFSLSVEYVNEGVDITDLKVGVFFDGKLYNGEYYTVKNIPKSELSMNLGFYVQNSAKYTIASHTPVLEDITLENSPQKDYDFWTFSDLGITDRTSNAYLNWDPKAAAVGDSIDKTVFNGKIDFPAGTNDFGNYYFGSSLRWYGLIFFANGSDGLKLYYNCKATGHFHNASGDTGSTKHANNQIALFDPEIAGTTLRGNADLDFALSVEYINETSTKTDLKVGVFFDGKLYNNEYYTVKDIPKSELSMNLGFYVLNSAKYTIASLEHQSSTISLEDVPEANFDFWSFSDLGIPDQTSNVNLNWKPKAASAGYSLDKTVFNGKIKFPADVTNFGNYYFGNSENWYGFIVTANGTDGLRLHYNCKETGKFHNASGNTGSTSLSGTEITSFKPAKAGTTLRGNEDLKFSLSVEYVNENGNNVDLKVGVFFDGKLYNNQYFTVKDIPKNEPAMNLGFYDPNSISYTIGSLEKAVEPVMLDESPESAFDFWTFADLRIIDQTSSERLNFDPKQPSAEGTLDKTVFDGMIDFPEGSDTFGNYYFGSGENWYGFAVIREGTEGLRLYYNSKETGHFHNGEGDTGTTAMTNTQIAVFHSEKAGTPLRGNPDLRFSLSVEYINETETHTDLKVGVFFDGKLYNGKYLTVKDIAKSELAKNLAFYVQNDAQYTVRSVGKICVADRTPADRKNITLMDAGILDVHDNAFGGKFDLDTLDGTLFSTRIKYGADGSRLHLGFGDPDLSFGGISFRLSGDNLVVSNEYAGSDKEGYGVLSSMPFTLVQLKPETAGVGTSFKDTEFLLEASIDFVDHDGDGNKDDIKLGVFINEVLYNNMYFYIDDDANNLGTRINFNSGKAVSALSYNYEGYYTELTAKDFGINEKTFSKTGYKAVYDSNSLDKTAITLDLKLSNSSGSRITFGGDSGVSFKQASADKISAYYTDLSGNETAIGELNAKKAGVGSFANTKLKWRFAFRVTPTSDASAYLKLGVYVNGKLYNGSFFTLDGVDINSLKRVISINAERGTISVSNASYEELTVKDFSVKNTSVTSIKGKDFRVENYCDLESLDGTAFSAVCRFPKKSMGRFTLGSPFWFGAFMASTADGRIQVAHCDTDKTVRNLVYLDAKTAGVKSFTDSDFTVKLTFDILDNGNGKADLNLGIYINGKLYNGQFYCVRNIDAGTLTRNLQIYATATPFTIKSAKSTTDLSVYGFSNTGWKRQLGIG